MSHPKLIATLTGLCALALLSASVWVIIQDPINPRVLIAAVVTALACACVLIAVLIALAVSIVPRRDTSKQFRRRDSVSS